MDPIDALWPRLQEVGVLQFQSHSRSGIGWSGAGSGVVRVTSIGSEILVFDEEGRWLQSGGNQIRFFNRFRWTRIEDRVSLEHMRFGPENPVFLFEMAADAKGLWHDVNPHPCQDDFYSATLRIDESRLFLDWSVQGLKRDESIYSVYI